MTGLMPQRFRRCGGAAFGRHTSPPGISEWSVVGVSQEEAGRAITNCTGLAAADGMLMLQRGRAEFVSTTRLFQLVRRDGSGCYTIIKSY